MNGAVDPLSPADVPARARWQRWMRGRWPDAVHAAAGLALATFLADPDGVIADVSDLARRVAEEAAVPERDARIALDWLDRVGYVVRENDTLRLAMPATVGA
jgi:hypothetical protein